MTPHFVQMHLLIDHTGVLLNRDDHGLAKRLTKGGFTRTRLSSQSIKRGLRMAQGIYSIQNITPDPVRTREIADTTILAHVRDEVPGADGETIEAALLQLNIHLYGKDGGDAKKRSNMLYGQAETDWLKTHVATAVRENPDPDRAAAAVANLFTGRDAKANFTAFRTQQVMPAHLAGAFWGRMSTADPLANIEAAVCVAHAFTIHEEQSEPDFFTSLDDLRLEQAGASSLLSTSELNSGIFYLYICVDVPLLVSNTTGCAREDWLSADRTVAAEGCAALAGLAATTSTGAKRGSTAPFTLAQVLLAEMGEHQPRSLASAYTRPAQPTVEDGLHRMKDQLSEFDRMYGTNEARLLMEPGSQVDIHNVRNWLRGAVIAGETP